MNKIKSFTKKKVFIIVLLLVLISLVALAGTYAWFSWRSINNPSVTIRIGRMADVVFQNGENINTAGLTPSYTYSDGVMTSFTINNRSNDASVQYSVNLNISELSNELKTESFKYTLVKTENNIDTVVASGDFVDAVVGEDMLILENGLLESGNNIDYKFYVHIDANYENTNLIGKTFVGSLNVTAVESINYALETLNRLTALNPDVKLDTTITPDLTKPSGNSSTYVYDPYDPYDGVTEPTVIENYGDGTNGIYESTDTIGQTYYFRGAVENNYVQFAGLTWRIIRINGDGSIRMITDNAPITNQKYNTGYNTQDKVNYEGSDIETAINNWYNTNIGNNSTYASKIVDTIFCNDRSIFKEENGDIYYSGWNRLYKSKMPSLECNTNDRLTRKAALITQDEAMMAGYGREYDDEYYEVYYNTNNYLRKEGIWFWTMTPNMFAWGYASVLGVYDYGVVYSNGVNSNGAGRPVISLKSDAITGGMGTSGNPFTVS